MPDSVLNDSDRAMLRRCPFTIYSSKRNKPTKAALREMQRVKSLWGAGKVRGEIEQSDENGYLLRVVLTDAGRREIGLLPQEASHVG